MKKFLIILLVLALGAGFGLLVRGNIVSIAGINGDSMHDTLSSGDYVLITCLDYLLDTPERGDIVQLEIPGRDGLYIKRVIGLPGDCVEITGGSVHINGNALYEDYATLSQDDFSVQLGDNEYFVLGDNRPVSYDSREEDFGVVRADCFRGRVRAILWPVDRISFGID